MPLRRLAVVALLIQACGGDDPLADIADGSSSGEADSGSDGLPGGTAEDSGDGSSSGEPLEGAVFELEIGTMSTSDGLPFCSTDEKSYEAMAISGCHATAEALGIPCHETPTSFVGDGFHCMDGVPSDRVIRVAVTAPGWYFLVASESRDRFPDFEVHSCYAGTPEGDAISGFLLAPVTQDDIDNGVVRRLDLASSTATTSNGESCFDDCGGHCVE